MKASKGVAQHRAWLGAAALATLVFGLTIAGADVTKTTRTTAGAGGHSVAPAVTSSPDHTDATTNVVSDGSSLSFAKDADKASSAVSSSANPKKRAVYQQVRAGQIPEGEFPLIAAHVVDYRDDDMTRARNEGRLVGPLPMTLQADVTAAGGCSFNVQCDDSDPCTTDICDIAPGAPVGTGKCTHTTVPDGQAGDCNDGNFCNGDETCVTGVCAPGQSTVCCSASGNETLCQPGFAVCSDDSGNAGDPCTQDTQCRGGRCDRCFTKCTTNSDCDDGLKCNGAETCNVGTGLCQRGPRPCGVGADCDEGRCNGGDNNNRGCTLDSACPGAVCVKKVCQGDPAIACVSNSECNGAAGPACVDMLAPVCYVGRCCDTAGEPVCSKRQLMGACKGGTNASASCKVNGDCPGGTCVSTNGNAPSPCPATSNWFAGDDGREALPPPTTQVNVAGCGGGPADLSEEYGCPKYSSGLTQTNSASPPVYSVTVGPVSDSSTVIPLPGGPGTALNKIGDDYTISNGSSLGLDVLRFVGGAVTPANRILIEFYDAAGNFVEDVVLPGQATTDVGIIRVEFEPELTIPASGFVVARAAGSFSPDTKLVWVSTTSASVGTNQTNVLWVNNGPGANFLSPNPGVLAFELVGDKLTTPSGACCDPATASCEDNVAPWVCAGRLDNYNGDGSRCAVCFGGTNPGGNCRKCVGGANNGLACTGAASGAGSCPGGSCQLNNATCPGSACTGPLAGNLCTTDTDCTLEGSCPSGTCVSGNVGASCVNDSDCDIPGTCGLAFCQASALCTNGACCNSSSGNCTITAGSGACAGGTFLGFGTDCDADNGRDSAQQHCCPQPQLSGQRCSGGPNNLTACTTDVDCRFCVGSPLGGIACTTNSNCARCVGGSTPGATCSVDADCPGDGDCQGECLGTCGARYTGADNAADAFVHAISVPGQGQPPVTVTITGNNAGATSTPQNPDSCFGALPNPTGDPGWFEAFSVNACAWVRIDHCCTNPVHEPAWAFMAVSDPTCNTTIANTPNPYHFAEVGNRRGDPWCADGDDNLWQSYGPLVPGETYILPIYSALAGHHGDYQVHITVENCPNAACCMGDGTCAFLNDPDCDAAGGTYLGPPGLATSQPNCSAPRCSGGPTPGQSCTNVGTQDNCGTGGMCALDPHGACTTGSCCVAPGDCRDNDTLGRSMTEAICDSVGFEGSFVGGVRCRGGSCPSVPSESCNSQTQCSNGLCVTDAQKDAQRNPCPICEFLGDETRCNADPGRFVWVSDTSETPGQSPTRQANDIMPAATEVLSSICVVGHYIGFYDNDNNGTFETRLDDCEDLNGGVQDNFTVRLFAPDSICQGGSANGEQCASAVDCPDGGSCVLRRYIPGQLLGEWAASHVPNPRTPATARAVATWGAGNRFYDFQLTLVPSLPNNPLFTLQAGQLYFLEVSDNTTGGDPECAFRMLDSAPGTGGNDYAFLDACGTEYSFNSLKVTTGDSIDAMSDPAWCLNVPFSAPDQDDRPDLLKRACCIGSPLNTCQVLGVRDCASQGGNWQLGQTTCTGFTCPHATNDQCSNAPFVREGSFPIDMYDVSQDGNPTEQCEGANPTAMDGDVWFFYQPSQSGQVYIGTCDCETGGDEVVSVYTGSSAAVCPCPGDAGMTLSQCRDGNQPNFIEPTGCQEFGDAGEVLINVIAGNCYTIRVAMFDGAVPSLPVLKIVQAPAVCGNNLREPLGGEQCDGTDDTLCSGECRYNCQCPPPACGNSTHEAGLGEECDATAPDVGAPCSPGLCNMNPAIQAPCTCIPNCGNNHREGSELCDGTDLGICGGAGCNNVTCRCNATCGNNVAEIGEQCDGTDDSLCPTRCGQAGALPCQCPTPSCGNNHVEEILNDEECDGTDITGLGKCDPQDCRPPGDPGGECTCACPGGTMPQPPVWNSTIQRSRALQVSAPPIVTSAGAAPQIAMEVKLTDLQTPVPANPPCCPPQNFGMWETGTCTGAGESGGCSRWVGRPTVFLESQDNGLLGTLKVAKLQCSPFYHDFGAEGLFEIAGPEIMPSSTFTLKTYSADCKGAEVGCAFVSGDVVASTRRSGDVSTPFAPSGTQPDSGDVVAIVNKFRNQPNALPKAVAQIQPNYIDANNDVGALDIVATIDAFRGSAYPYSGPCACPSTVTCNATSCGACAGGGLCVKTCTGGPNAGQPCITDKHCRTCAGGSLAGAPCLTDGNCPGGTCPAVGTCPATGFCRDRCGRCKP